MVVSIGLAILSIGSLVPQIVRSVREKVFCRYSDPPSDNPQKNTLIVSLGFWPGTVSPDNKTCSARGSHSQVESSGLNQTLAINISKSIYKEITSVSFCIILAMLLSKE